MQDYDGHFPPSVSYTSETPPETGTETHRGHELFARSWGPNRILADGRIVQGLLDLYVKSDRLYVAPGGGRLPGKKGDLYYMYNDLLNGVPQDALTNPSRTVLITCAENRPGNAGHALTLGTGPFGSSFNAHGGCDPGQGATVGKEARFR